MYHIYHFEKIWMLTL